jgi:hypothetical protein
MVTLGISAAGTGISIGQPLTVQYFLTPQTPFDVDFTHADAASVASTGFLFAAPTDLVVGQQVSVRRNTASTGATIKVDRVRLRSSRITATVQLIGSGIITLTNLPSIFFGHGGLTQIQAQTSLPTIFFEIGHSITISNIGLSNMVSVRGPLFNVSGGRTLVATKVALKL